MIWENTGAATVPPKIGVGPVEDHDHGERRGWPAGANPTNDAM